MVEVVEESMEVKLRDNQLRLRLSGAPIVEGLSFHEVADNSVDLLIPTLTSVHRISFPHPAAVTTKVFSI